MGSTESKEHSPFVNSSASKSTPRRVLPRKVPRHPPRARSDFILSDSFHLLTARESEVSHALRPPIFECVILHRHELACFDVILLADCTLCSVSTKRLHLNISLFRHISRYWLLNIHFSFYFYLLSSHTSLRV